MQSNGFFRNICGTKEEWAAHKEEYRDYYKMPATVYMSESGVLFLVTSQEWKDYLLRRTDMMPHTDKTDE